MPPQSRLAELLPSSYPAALTTLLTMNLLSLDATSAVHRRGNGLEHGPAGATGHVNLEDLILAGQAT
jgi:hypothetical protein